MSTVAALMKRKGSRGRTFARFLALMLGRWAGGRRGNEPKRTLRQMPGASRA